MDQLDPVTENELDLFSRINHENIVKYLDHFHMRIGDENKTFLINEYCQVGSFNSSYKVIYKQAKDELKPDLERRFEEENRRG